MDAVCACAMKIFLIQFWGLFVLGFICLFFGVAFLSFLLPGRCDGKIAGVKTHFLSLKQTAKTRFPHRVRIKTNIVGMTNAFTCFQKE